MPRSHMIKVPFANNRCEISKGELLILSTQKSERKPPSIALESILLKASMIGQREEEREGPLGKVLESYRRSHVSCR